MKKKIENFYLKKSSFLFFGVTAMLGWLAWGISTIVCNNPIKLAIFGVIFFLLTGGMTLSYIKGETNIQKMLFGSLILFLIVDYIEIVEVYITYQIIPTAIVTGITLVILIVFFICHALQQQDHIGKTVNVVINQCCGIIIILTVAFLTVGLVYGTIVLTDYTFSVAMVFTTCLIICMETRINVYKQIRAKHKANGDWNEETRAEAKKLFKI